MKHLLPLLLLAACGPDDPYTEGGGLHFADYVPPAEAWLQYGPAEDPAAGPWLMIEVGSSSWDLRQGESWVDASSTEELAYTADDGLVLASSLVLPAELTEGGEQDGVQVLTIGDESVYYGTFPMAARCAVPSGRFAGEWVFAPAVGPVRMVIDDQIWELVYYL